jgi:hypothetical protein
MSKSHNLKTLPRYYEPAALGLKTFEVRKNDRNFKVGDSVTLKEWTGAVFTGRNLGVFEITYILDDFEGLAPGYVVLGLQ